jgi:hypothetical protein
MVEVETAVDIQGLNGKTNVHAASSEPNDANVLETLNIDAGTKSVAQARMPLPLWGLVWRHSGLEVLV